MIYHITLFTVLVKMATFATSFLHTDPDSFVRSGFLVPHFMFKWDWPVRVANLMLSAQNVVLSRGQMNMFQNE